MATEHIPTIVPGFNLKGDEVFAMHCSCGSITPGYTSKDAAIEGGKGHVDSRTRLEATFARIESRK